MAAQLIYKLQIITLLDSICFGLTYPFLSTYIQSLGADHVVVGVLSDGYLLCSLISNDIIQSMEFRKRQLGMFIILFTTMLTHLSLIVTNSYWLIICGRCIYSIVANQSQNMCKDLLCQNAEADKKDHVLTAFAILNGSGYVIGPIIAGYLFDEGFLYIGLLAVLLTAVNICLAVTTSDNSNSSEQESNGKTILSKICENVNNIVDDCQHCLYKKNWDLLAIRFLHVSCIMIFNGKFSQILKYNYQSSTVTVGSTYAYMNILTFAGVYFAPFVKDQCASFSPIKLLNYCLKSLAVCLVLACYAPVYSMYIIMCIPVVLLNTFIDFIWRDLLVTRKEDPLERLNDTIKTGAGFVTPIVFGVLCNTVGHHAVIIFSVIPAIASTFIINNNKRFEETDKKNE